jgi:hypothetical protein
MPFEDRIPTSEYSIELCQWEHIVSVLVETNGEMSPIRLTFLLAMQPEKTAEIKTGK